MASLDIESVFFIASLDMASLDIESLLMLPLSTAVAANTEAAPTARHMDRTTVVNFFMMDLLGARVCGR
ncbi:hypothetical protein D3C76_1739680 [compost metagenome]